jgi:hypothetical protein
VFSAPEANAFWIDSVTVVSAVPEPGFIGLLCLASAGLGLAIRRKKSKV